jgi:hypothetical protein
MLKSRGWSYRSVAPVLGVTHIHLSYVLNGHRISRRLLESLKNVPLRGDAR